MSIFKNYDLFIVTFFNVSKRKYEDPNFQIYGDTYTSPSTSYYHIKKKENSARVR